MYVEYIRTIFKCPWVLKYCNSLFENSKIVLSSLLHTCSCFSQRPKMTLREPDGVSISVSCCLSLPCVGLGTGGMPAPTLGGPDRATVGIDDGTCMETWNACTHI